MRLHMRRIAPASVSPDVLKHFAVLTLVITGGLAMFANGEKRNALAEQVRQRQMQAEAVRAARAKASQRTVVVDGLRIAPGTRVDNSDVRPDFEPSTNVQGPAPVMLADFPQAAVAGPAVPPGVGPGIRDANGRMAPPPPVNMRMRPRQGQPQPVARSAPPSSEQEVNAMIQASAQRAGNRPVE